MAKTETLPWDASDHLDDPAAIAAYLNAALEDGDPSLVAAALGDIARSRGMGAVAQDAGLGRTSLYKALSDSGKPEFATVMKVVKSLGLRLTVSPVEPSSRSAAGL
jgi:probable addiction module antidote protein